MNTQHTVSTNIDIDIDLSDYDTSDLIEALEDRRFSLSEIDSINALLKKGTYYPAEVETTTEKWKYDYFMKHFQDIPMEKLEEIVKVA